VKLRKGDEVVVLSGKDIGKRGTITHVLPEREKVIVTGTGANGINVVKRHTKPRGATIQGGIIDKEMPIHISNVALWCSKCGATRVGYRFDEAGKKIRICRRCEADV
jgi:large subunit ribosomal protein L24